MKSENIRDGIIIFQPVCYLIFFFGTLKSDWGKKTPSITLSQLRVLLEVVLPLRTYDIDGAISLVKRVQEKNHKAYLSHRKKRLENIAMLL